MICESDWSKRWEQNLEVPRSQYNWRAGRGWGSSTWYVIDCTDQSITLQLERCSPPKEIVHDPIPRLPWMSQSAPDFVLLPWSLHWGLEDRENEEGLWLVTPAREWWASTFLVHISWHQPDPSKIGSSWHNCPAPWMGLGCCLNAHSKAHLTPFLPLSVCCRSFEGVRCYLNTRSKVHTSEPSRSYVYIR